MGSTKISMEQVALFDKVFNRGRQAVYGCDDRPVREQLTREILREHLQGINRIGVYPVKQRKTPFLVFDIDEHDLPLVKTLVGRLGKLGLPAYVEKSKAKGYHAWVFFKPKVLASRARALAKAILNQCENPPRVEVFPKQDSVEGKRVGNFIYLPLFGQSVKEGRTVFIDLANGGEPYPDQFMLLGKLRFATLKDLELACEELGVEDEEKRPGLAGVWGEIPSKPPKQFFNLLNKTDDRLRHTWDGTREDLHDKTRSGHEFAMAALCQSNGFTKEETLAICKAMPGGRRAKGKEKWRRDSIDKVFSKTSTDDHLYNRLFEMNEYIEMKLPKARDLIAPGILPKNGRMVIGGQPKEGKSLLALQLALSLASGSPFLDQFHIKKARRVLISQQEMTPGDMQERVRSLSENLPKTKPDYLYLENARNLRLDRTAGRERLQNYIREKHLEVLILDPFYKLHNSDENSAQAMNRILRRLDVLRESGVAIVLVHHHRKPTQGDYGSVSLRGSGVLFAWGDSYLNLYNKGSGRFKLTFDLRTAAMPEPLSLKRDPMSLTFSVEETTATREVPPELVQKSVKGSGRIGNQELIEKLKKEAEASDRTVREAIKEAKKTGLIKRRKTTGGRGFEWTAS